MKTEKLYKYLGRNGSILSPVLLVSQEPIIMTKLEADKGKVLTNGSTCLRIKYAFLDEVDDWYEIDDPKGKKD